MDVVVLHNEKAGDERWTRKDLLRRVRDAGFEPRYYPVASALDEPKVLEQGEFVIVAGGDGSIRKAALALAGRGRPLAPLPLGTANNIVRSFELKADPDRFIAGWRRPQRRAFDLGVVEGPWGRRHFVEGIGIGLISRTIAVLDHIDELADYELKKAKHRLHRDLCVATALAHELGAIPAKLSFDGRVVADRFLLLEILNIRRAGPGMELAPQASPCDGRLDLVSVVEAQRPKLLHIFESRLTDRPHERSLTTRRARKVQLRVHAPCDMRIDDDTVRVEADTNVTISLQRGALEFLLPR